MGLSDKVTWSRLQTRSGTTSWLRRRVAALAFKKKKKRKKKKRGGMFPVNTLDLQASSRRGARFPSVYFKSNFYVRNSTWNADTAERRSSRPHIAQDPNATPSHLPAKPQEASTHSHTPKPEMWRKTGARQKCTNTPAYTATRSRIS